jgi:DNA-binding MarR family transcriptional regulator
VDDPSDRRSIKAALTAAGRSRYEEGARLLDAAEGELFAGLADPERATLSRLLRTLQKDM